MGWCLHGLCDGIASMTVGHDVVWVIVERLTKSAHFLRINKRYSLEKLTQIYIKEIVSLHGVPATVV